MFRIYDGREHFYQWDSDQLLIVDDPSIKQVHFANCFCDAAEVCLVREEDGVRVVDVPNDLLQLNLDIRVWAFDTNKTKFDSVFEVERKTKPVDYIYTPTETLCYETLDARIREFEENGVSQEAVEAAINEYFIDNPIESGATAEQVEQLNQNTADIEKVESDLVKYINEYDGYIADIHSNYAKKTEIPDTSGFLTSIPDEYINETELAAKGYATQQYVDKAVEGVDVDLTGYATEKYVDDAVKNVEVDLTGYATEEYVGTAITNAFAAIGVAEDGEY